MATNRVKQLIRELPKNNHIMGKAMRAAGYSDSYAHNPHLLKATKGYNKVVMKEMEKIELERNKILDEMNSRDLSPEKYESLSRVYVELTKTKQLLEGKPTEITQSSVANLSDADLEAMAEDEEPSKEGASEEGVSEEATG